MNLVDQSAGTILSCRVFLILKNLQIHKKNMVFYLLKKRRRFNKEVSFYGRSVGRTISAFS